MSKKDSEKAFKPITEKSDEYWELFDSLVPVLSKHFKNCKKFHVNFETDRFIWEYNTMMMDFWPKEQAINAIIDIRNALNKLVSGYERLPAHVLEDIRVNTEGVDEMQKEKFLETTNLDLISQEMLPEKGARMAFDALEPLCKHYNLLLQAVDQARRELPAGIPTRSRPLREWALIHAASELVRTNDAMNIPKEIESAGPFARLLRDVFRVYGIEKEDFRGVYRGWRKHMDGKLEDFDLMPI